MRPMAWMKEMRDLNNKAMAAGIITASAGLLLIAFVVLILNPGEDNHEATRGGVIMLEVSVPHELPLSEGSRATLDNGASLAVSGDKATLRFQSGYLEGIDLPLVIPPGQQLMSFSDRDTGMSLDQHQTGERILTVLLPSEQGGLPIVIRATVESIETHDSHVSISMSQMSGQIDILPGIFQGNQSSQIQQISLDIELRRLPRDARLNVSRLAELNPLTSAVIDSATVVDEPPWAITLAIEVRRINLENGEDLGEAVLSILMPDPKLGLKTETAVVHVDKNGDGQLLALEQDPTTNGESVLVPLPRWTFNIRCTHPPQHYPTHANVHDRCHPDSYLDSLPIAFTDSESECILNNYTRAQSHFHTYARGDGVPLFYHNLDSLTYSNAHSHIYSYPHAHTHAHTHAQSHADFNATSTTHPNTHGNADTEADRYLHTHTGAR